MKQKILYVFGGERAQGAEIVIERLMLYNVSNVDAHLMIAPGAFASQLMAAGKPYQIITEKHLGKLYRSSSSAILFYLKALVNYIIIPVKVYRYIKRQQINIVHANTIVPASYLLPAIFLGKIFLKDVRWIWSDHDMRYYSKLENLLAKWCSKFYDITLVVSEAVKRKYPNAVNTLVLYNGLETGEFAPEETKRRLFRKRFNFTDTQLVIGIAGTINPGKGVLALINAFKEIAWDYPDLLLLICGSYALDDQAYNREVKQEIESHERIIFAGYIDDMPAYYNGCDIVMNNSDLFRSESLGTSIYEAMACEKIVVASGTGGTPEIITDGQDGYLFPPENQAALVSKLKHVIQSFNNSTSVMKMARQTVKLKFNITVMAQNYNRILSISNDN